MNLAQIKTSKISKRKLFQIERAIVRQVTDLWCMEKSYFSDNFAEDVEVNYRGKKIDVAFTNRGRMKHGMPEATVNDMIKGLILTMSTDQATGNLLDIYEAVTGNILDVFVHRLREFAERKFIFQRLQTLDLGFSVAFGLDKRFYPIKKARRLLEYALITASLCTADEIADTLIHDVQEALTILQAEGGVTFHVFMAKQTEASFISLPLGMQQATYVSLLGTHTLRCNILAKPTHENTIKSGVLKIDAPSNPVNFIRHKGFDLQVDEKKLMGKLCSGGEMCRGDFSAEELLFLKLLFNEYVSLAGFLLSSNRIDPGLKLLIIFPRINFFRILHEENSLISIEEPQTLGELASFKDMLFPENKLHKMKARKKTRRISEKVIQEKVYEAISALARNSRSNLYKPLTDIRRQLLSYSRAGYSDEEMLEKIKKKTNSMSSYLKLLNRVQKVVLDEAGMDMDMERSVSAEYHEEPVSALDEIIRNIQAAEVEQSKEIVVSKMLDYLSFVTVRLEQLSRVSSVYIKEEIVREIESYTTNILAQAKAFYKLVLSGKNGS